MPHERERVEIKKDNLVILLVIADNWAARITIEDGAQINDRIGIDPTKTQIAGD